MKKLLMICYYFPPIGAVASQRPAKFVKFLKEFGWEPIVITRKEDPMYHTDSSLLNDLNVKIYRSLRSSLLSRIAGIASLVRLDFVKRLFGLPDVSYDTVFRVVPSLLRYIEEEKPDVIWISAVPTTMVLLGIILKKITTKPIIIDFHNEWTKYMYYKPFTSLHDAANVCLERKAILAADAVVTLNPWHTADLKQRFAKKEIYTIENGFDPEDFQVVQNANNDKFTLTYAGAIYGHQKIDGFLSILNESGLDVRVNILGDTFGEFRQKKYKFELNYFRNVPHSELYKYYSASDAFFLELDTGAARQLPAKLYEYIQTGKAVIAKVPNQSVAAEFIRKNSCGFVVQNVNELGNAIEKIRCGFKPNSEKIQLYNRRNLTKELSSILDSVLKPKVTIRSYPYPYKCALSISSDMDECTADRYKELKEIFNGIPVSCHYFVFNSNPYFDDQINLLKNPEIANDPGFSLHTYGDFNYRGGFRRHMALEAKEILTKAGLRSYVWVNHGDKKNIQNIGSGEGDLPSSLAYHADIMKELGVRFVWNYELSNALPNERGHIIYNLLSRMPIVRKKFNLITDDQIVHSLKLRDGSSLYCFVRYGDWDKSQVWHLPDVLNYRVLGRLKKSGGAIIVYTHLGIGAKSKKMNEMVKKLQTDDIWVDYIHMILNYMVVRQGLRFRSFIRGKVLHIEITNVIDPVLGKFVPSRADLKKLTFYYDLDAEIRVTLGKELLPVSYNPPDATGKRSFTIL